MDEFDPTADFLAREQAILGADAALFGNPMATGSPGAAAAAISPTTLLNDIDQLVPGGVALDTGAVPVATLQGDAFATSNGASTGLFSATQAPLVQESIFDQSAVFPDVANGTFEEPAPQIPPTSQAMLDWQAEFDAKIADRDSKEKDKHARMLAEAKESLERFYAEYNEKKAKGIARNKELEQQTIAQRDAAAGNVWERVLKQVEVPPKPKVDPAAKKGPHNTEEKKSAAKKATNETARFKQVLTSLKNDPNAPGLTA
ncbi:hypothetical protein HDV03_001943 [Kappamyces sp. JEL0829]|nr:hypothetical protein HDV03_001943 [Kappamyces sp. JEL0829]